MDENYLDNLLKDVSADGKKNNSFEDTMDMDAGVDLDLSDIKDISLDELDDLDDVDLSGLDLDDIDFDDIDVTKLDSDGVGRSVADDNEDFNLDELIEAEDSFSEATEEPVEKPSVEQAGELSDDGLDGLSDTEQEDIFTPEDMSYLDGQSEEKQNQDIRQDDVFKEADNEMQDDISFPEEMVHSEDEINNMDIDDLFSALDIRNDDNDIFSVDNSNDDADNSRYTAGEDELDALFSKTMQASMDSEDLADIVTRDESKDKKTGKKTISEIIFGVPDEEDIEEERLYEQKRAEKKDKKAKTKEEKLAKKTAVLEARKRENDNKKKNKDNIKKQKQELLKAELEEEKSEKKVPVPVVVIVFAIFAAIGAVVVLGTKQFDYTRVIHKAADYFERQRYHLAYDEVSGVDVKKKDEELRDRIYTVMYVERLYESYENNMAVNRPDKALDALIRGLEKYDEHYAEAVELDIVEDIDSCRDKIVSALYATYGLTEAQAYDIMKLSGQEYTQTLMKYSEVLQTGE